MKNALSDVKVIVFDNFGTVVDWRSSISDDLSGWGSRHGIDTDWEKFADDWRDQYEPQKNRVRSGEIEWTNLDNLHRDALDHVLSVHNLAGLSDHQKDHINRVWHRLAGWPDAIAGLARLKEKYVIGPLSNGNVALLVNMAKHAKLPWDMIFSCELFGHYKPHPETYTNIPRMMYVAPHQVMMCAAHNYDLAAARACGLQTAFIPRPHEHGPNQTTDLAPTEMWDVIAKDLVDLAEQMGA